MGPELGLTVVHTGGAVNRGDYLPLPISGAECGLGCVSGFPGRFTAWPGPQDLGAGRPEVAVTEAMLSLEGI